MNAAACVESIIAEGNGKHFFVATQDVELRRKLREVTLPLLSLFTFLMACAVM